MKYGSKIKCGKKMWIRSCSITDQKDVDQKSVTEDWIIN